MPSIPYRVVLLGLLVTAIAGFVMVPAVAAQSETPVRLVDSTTPDDATVGEPTPIELTVGNTQSHPTNVTVQAAGATKHTVTVELRPNSERTVTLEPEAPPKRGAFDVAVTLWERDGGVPFVADRLTVDATTLQSGSQLTVRPLTARQAVAAGEPATVGFEIINQGDTETTATFELDDSESTRERTVTLSDGESTVESAAVTAPQSGETTVSLTRQSGSDGAEATVTATEAPVTASIVAYDPSDDQLILTLKNTREEPAQAFLRLTRDPGVGAATTNVAEQAIDLDPDATQRVNVSTTDFEIGRGHWSLSLTNLIVDGEAAVVPNTTTHTIHDTFIETSDNLAPSKDISQSNPPQQESSGDGLPVFPLLGVMVLVGGVGGGYIIGSRAL